MFDNVIGQAPIINQLKIEIAQKIVPPSMLFVGSFATAKLTTALEFARVATCLKYGEWGCDCSSCLGSRSLISPYIMMLGSRYFNLEIELSSKTFLANPTNVASYFLYLRAIRKLTRRFDASLHDDDSTAIKKSRSYLEAIEELLFDIKIENNLSQDKLDKKIRSINNKAIELAGLVENKEISISQIRNLSNWSRSNSQNMKIVILENIELMSISAANALLKILEEPPKRLHFILIARQTASLMPTILSRVRAYHFIDRSISEDMSVIERIFKTKANSLKELFLSQSGFDMKQYVSKFYDGRENRQDFKICYNAKELGFYVDIFWNQLLEHLQKLWQTGQISSYRAELELALVKKLVDQHYTLNQNHTNLAETFFYSYNNNI